MIFGLILVSSSNKITMAEDALTLTIERTFAAPVERVWRAWSDRDIMANWWGLPGMEVLMAKHDFQEGGEWRYIMPMPDGSEFVSEGEYQEIQDGSRILTSASFLPMTDGVIMDISLVGHDGGTQMTFSVIHQTEVQKEAQENMGFFKGWGIAFDRLAEVVGKE
jgi:uncharacterized protein YndB with AHSA1/START domain